MRANDDDGALLAAATTDVAAFEALYRRYVGRVTAFAIARCSSSADVGDVVAQTFVRLMKVADRYDPDRGEPGAFIFAVAGNVLRDHERGVRRQHRLVYRIAGRDLLDADEISQVEEALDAARLVPAVEQALSHVTDNEEQVLRLVAGGATPAEAADTLGVSPGVARLRLFRARRRVRSQLPFPTSDVEAKEA